MNFKNFSDEPPGSGGGSRPPNIFPLARQSSVYSLTFDEFQSTMGGSIGKDFGSMNMDELLKNIWTAEDIQQPAGQANPDSSGNPSNYLQRQGSLTLPRTLSQKTVDEVWKDLSTGMTNLPLRQQTLGEVTLEEFLFRAGVVREEQKLPEKPQNFDLLGDLTRPVSNQPLGFGFQNTGNNNKQQPIFPKQPAFAYNNCIPNANSTQVVNPGIRTGMTGIADPHHPNSNGRMGMVGITDPHHPSPDGGLGMIGNGVTVATDSPTLSSDGIGRNNGDNSSVSPLPYIFTGGLRGRRSNNAVEKVIERRQRRMIKNRESAARSRARKQAYTTELEAEVAKLKEENEKLLKKQAEIMEMQKNQVSEMMTMPQGGKRRRLTRTQTGPW